MPQGNYTVFVHLGNYTVFVHLIIQYLGTGKLYSIYSPGKVYSIKAQGNYTVFRHQRFCGRWAVGGLRVSFTWGRRWRETIERGRVE